jgi:hypothetical protein
MFECSFGVWTSERKKTESLCRYRKPNCNPSHNMLKIYHNIHIESSMNRTPNLCMYSLWNHRRSRQKIFWYQWYRWYKCQSQVGNPRRSTLRTNHNIHTCLASVYVKGVRSRLGWTQLATARSERGSRTGEAASCTTFSSCAHFLSRHGYDGRQGPKKDCTHARRVGQLD